MKGNILRWFGRVMRKVETEAVRVVKRMNVERRRGKPKKRCSDTIEGSCRYVCTGRGRS